MWINRSCTKRSSIKSEGESGKRTARDSCNKISVVEIELDTKYNNRRRKIYTKYTFSMLLLWFIDYKRTE